MKFATYALLAVAFVVDRVQAVRICGNYCGPDWCSGEKIPECADIEGPSCVQSDENCREAGPTDGSCADQCCKDHDRCCGSKNRRPCNDALDACLSACTGTDCKLDGVPIPNWVIRDGFDKLKGPCCGEDC